jgi:sugar/nucleoside kinase (ribokinase family)
VFGSAIGNDGIGDYVLEVVAEKRLDTCYIRRDWDTTSRTVVVIDSQGNRQCINDPQYVHAYRYPETELADMFQRADLVYTSTQNWCRYLAHTAHAQGKMVAVDVQAIIDVDEYHRDFIHSGGYCFAQHRAFERPLTRLYAQALV